MIISYYRATLTKKGAQPTLQRQKIRCTNTKRTAGSGGQTKVLNRARAPNRYITEFIFIHMGLFHQNSAIVARTSAYCEDRGLYKNILTMVSYFLRWALLSFFSSTPDEQSQQIIRQWGRIACAVINNQMKLSAHYCENFEFITFLGEF